MSPLPIEEPPFIKNIAALQKVLAAIAVSILIVIWLGGWDYIQEFFDKNGFLSIFNDVRALLGIACAIITSFVGYHQIGNMMSWIIEGYETWKKINDMKKGK